MHSYWIRIRSNCKEECINRCDKERNDATNSVNELREVDITLNCSSRPDSIGLPGQVCVVSGPMDRSRLSITSICRQECINRCYRV